MTKFMFFILVTIILSVSSCGNSGAAKNDADETNDADNAVSSSLKDSIQALLNDQLYFSNGAGSAVKIDDGKSPFTVTAGYADIENKTPITADSLFRIASVSKTFAATLILRLYEDSLLTLEDTLDKWYPDYPNADKITVRMLLSHTSGISDYSVMGTPEEIIESTKSLAPYFAPGTDWAYSNTNFIFLGRIAEKLTGKSYGAALREKVLTPAGLEHTFFEPEETLPAGLPNGYLYENGELYEATATALAWVDGAVVSTVGDLAKFARLLFEGGLLKEATLKEMLTFYEKNGKKIYGLGLLYYYTPYGEGYGHGGNLINFNGEISYFPDIKTVIVIQSNYPVSSDTEKLRRDILSLIYKSRQEYKPNDCKAPESLLQNDSAVYDTMRIRGTINDLTSTDIEAANGFFYYSKGFSLDPFWCAEYAYRYNKNGTDFVYLQEFCPDQSRYYTGSVNIGMTELLVPLDKLISLKTAGGNSVTEGLDFAKSEVWLDYASGRITKKCFLAIPDMQKASEVFVCPEGNTAFAVGEEIRAWANMNMTDAITEDKKCYCYDANGVQGPCKGFDENFGCDIPSGYFDASGNSYSLYKFTGELNDFDLASSNPKKGEAELTVMIDGEAVTVTGYQDIAGTLNYNGKDWVLLQTIGDLKQPNATTYTFNLTQTYFDKEQLISLKDSSPIKIPASQYLALFYAYTQKVKTSKVYTKSCVVAADDPLSQTSSFLICPKDNEAFAPGETLKLAGNIALTTDKTTISQMTGSSNECECADPDGKTMDCAEFEAIK